MVETLSQKVENIVSKIKIKRSTEVIDRELGQKQVIEQYKAKSLKDLSKLVKMFFDIKDFQDMVVEEDQGMSGHHGIYYSYTLKDDKDVYFYEFSIRYTVWERDNGRYKKDSGSYTFNINTWRLCRECNKNKVIYETGIRYSGGTYMKDLDYVNLYLRGDNFGSEINHYYGKQRLENGMEKLKANTLCNGCKETLDD